ncbi:hypothetical protein GCM10009733_021440 [Nonomuraea maheshkhaliensis]|uniref:GH18 domain-containing protein n=1 Tax=Nonomuraea maheshkhaliensis TaxID=419590 RepID=A0ABN2F0T9_9ACTN
MKRIHFRRRGWITIAVILAAAVTGSAGLAIANPTDDSGNAAACAQWDDVGTQGYQECLDNLAGTSGAAGFVAGGQASTSPSISATSLNAGGNPPFYFCRDKGRSATATTKPTKECKDTLVCLWQPDDGKYHCVDGKGTSVSPPGRICTTNPHFACADDVVIASLPAEAPSPTDSPTAASPGDGTPEQRTPASSASASSPSSTPTSATPTNSPTPTIAADDPVSQAVAAAQENKLRIWLESDLIGAWKAGPGSLKTAAEQLALYARQPGVVGVKFAYDLGLRGFSDADQINQFVTETSQALRAALPAGRRIAVDIVVPELGCGAHQACVTAMRKAYPQASLTAVERYVLSGDIDAVNVSAVFGNQYESFKIQPAAVINNVWLRLRQLSWETRMPGLDVGSREIGLAHSGDTRPRPVSCPTADPKADECDAKAAAQLVRERVDVPLRRGAKWVVLWTWEQTFDNQTWRLADRRQDTNGGHTNEVWKALRSRSLRVNITYNPSEPGAAVAEDVRTIAEVASAVFLFVPTSASAHNESLPSSSATPTR